MMNIDSWQEALLADGWTAERIYPSARSQAFDPALSARFKRDGFVIRIFRLGDSLGSNDLIIRGPDKLLVTPPDKYGWAELQRIVHTCEVCGAVGKTVGMRGQTYVKRVCMVCYGRLSVEAQTRSWADLLDWNKYDLRVGDRVAWTGYGATFLRVGHVVRARLGIICVEWDEKNPSCCSAASNMTKKEVRGFVNMGFLVRRSMP